MTNEIPNVNPSSKYELRQVSKALQVHKSTILRWTHKGHLRCTIRKVNRRRVWTGAEIIRFWKTMM